MKLDKKVAIVTGGGTGIGKGISRMLAREGARVTIAQPRIETAEAACRELEAEGFDVMPLSVDVRDRARVREMISRTMERWGSVDILVNNAALTGTRSMSSFLDMTDEFLDQIIDVNLKGTVICSQEAARGMTDSGGAIINISSVGGFAAQEGASVYCATKAGIIGLTKAMALDLAPHGIRVNCVAPGDIATERNEDIRSEIVEEGMSGKYLREIPMGRRGTPEDIGKAVVFLASEDSAYVTGETLIVDGGFLVY